MKKIFYAAMLVLTMTSCATVINGTTQKMTIRSKSNKEIVIKDSYNEEVARGKGELVVSLARSKAPFQGAEYKIIAGSSEKRISSNPNLLKGILGNFFLPPLGLWYGLIDAADGAIFELHVNGQNADVIEVE